MPADTVLIIRCPYCLAEHGFRPMIAYRDGRFVCRNCAHTVRPGIPDYRCTCCRCLKINATTKVSPDPVDVPS
jgi:hypothetical protein